MSIGTAPSVCMRVACTPLLERARATTTRRQISRSRTVSVSVVSAEASRSIACNMPARSRKQWLSTSRVSASRAPAAASLTSLPSAPFFPSSSRRRLGTPPASMIIAGMGRSNCSLRLLTSSSSREAARARAVSTPVTSVVTASHISSLRHFCCHVSSLRRSPRRSPGIAGTCLFLEQSLAG
eukprot:1178858-Prorocentrum_minimum.AAC.3